MTLFLLLVWLAGGLAWVLFVEVGRSDLADDGMQLRSDLPPLDRALYSRAADLVRAALWPLFLLVVLVFVVFAPERLRITIDDTIERKPPE